MNFDELDQAMRVYETTHDHVFLPGLYLVASGVFSCLIGEPVCFDCRISELPSLELVIDYFRWRNEDAARNSLNAYCYWTMRKQGKSVNKATKHFEKKSVSEKNEYLFQQGINFNEVPLWQKRGIGFYYSAQSVKGKNPVTGEDCITSRKALQVNESLPMKEEYGIWLKNLIKESENK